MKFNAAAARWAAGIGVVAAATFLIAGATAQQPARPVLQYQIAWLPPTDAAESYINQQAAQGWRVNSISVTAYGGPRQQPYIFAVLERPA